MILFWNDNLNVFEGLSVHHQEFKTVHTATGICQTDDDGMKDRPKHVVYSIVQ